MPHSLDKFVANLVDSGLVGSGDVDRFLRALSPEHSPQNGEQLARTMIRQGLLTPFQAQRVYQGKGRSLVLGNYVLLNKIGQGGMGAVFKARHRRMDRVVALKVVSPDVIKTDESLHRFHREVRAAARLNHVNIVTAYDADEVDGTHFLVMEYVDGRDLANIVKAGGPLPVEHALNCILQAARALQYAHDHGVIHRDIKPGNLLLDRSGTVKILDMGLARFEDAGDVSSLDLTKTDTVMGTVDYMAPEQAVSTHDADARSDIYSLGITLWFLLTGRAPYEGKTLMARLLAHRDQPIPSLADHCSEAPAGLNDVFCKMVAKKQADRYQSMGEVVAALSAVLRGEPETSPSTLAAPVDPRLNEFLGALNGSPQLADGDSASDFVLTQPEAPPSPAGHGVEPTFLLGDPESDTDTRTGGVELRQPISSISAPRAAGIGRSKWPGAWVLGGSALAAIAVLVLGAILFLQKPATGTLLLKLTQPELVGATVLIDGRARASVRSLDEVSPIRLPADGRDHQLQVSQPGYRTFARTFRIVPERATSIDVQLQPVRTSGSAASASSRLVRDVDWLLRHGAILQVNGPDGLHQVEDFVEYDRRELPVYSVSFRPGWHVDDDTVLHLQSLRTLEVLDLSGTTVTDASMSYLSRLTDLSVLNLSGTAVTDRGLGALISCRRLTVLSLAGTSITDAGVANLTAFPALRQLVLDGTVVTDGAVASLARCPQLVTLSLNDCRQLSESVGKSLRRIHGLQQVFLGGVGISDETMHDLAEIPLTQLALTNTPLGDAALSDLTSMHHLVYLSLRGTRLSKAGTARLANTLLQCHIETDYGDFSVPREKVDETPLPETPDRGADPARDNAPPGSPGFFSREPGGDDR